MYFISMIPTKLIKSIFNLLHSNVSPLEIALGFALGSIIGLTPFFTLHNLFIFLLLIILNINFSAGMLGIAVFGLIGYLTDPLAHKIGYLLLVKTKFLEGFWTSLYNMPIVPFTRFYNTVVLGSLVISLILFVPIVIGTKKFVVFYRNNLSKKVEQWKIIKLIKASNIYNLYKKFNP
ncbi:MAG: TIGR03546 family protein [Endomicrobiia bacterium]